MNKKGEIECVITRVLIMYVLLQSTEITQSAEIDGVTDISRRYQSMKSMIGNAIEKSISIDKIS